MRALVLGAGGQLGFALVNAPPPNIEVIALDRSACDVCDSAQLSSAIERTAPDILVNAAAYTAVDKAESDPLAAERANAVAPRLMAEIASRRGIRLVHVSTDFVFDGRHFRPYKPDDRTNPLSVYGKSKRAGEEAVLAAAPDSLVVRTAWVYSARGQNFVRTMLRLFSERETVRVVADQFGTPTHAATLADALWGLAQKDVRGIYHVTDAGSASWYDFAVAISEEAARAGLLTKPVSVVPITTAEYPTPAARPPFSVLDKDKTWQVLGAPARHWRSALRDMVGGLRNG